MRDMLFPCFTLPPWLGGYSLSVSYSYGVAEGAEGEKHSLDLDGDGVLVCIEVYSKVVKVRWGR
jgi:hypothetical protein